MKLKDRIRFILNVLFLLAAVATIIMYITDSKSFFYAGITALTLKVFEYILRFVN